jgi:hypothetical protein
MASSNDPGHELTRLQTNLDKAHRERWATHADPILQLAETSRRMAHAYAKMGFQTMFFLNGGALIAFPAFAQLLGKTFSLTARPAALSIGAFICGLVALAHVIDDKVEAAYRRGDPFEKRRRLMEAWAGYCVKLPAGAPVVSIDSGAPPAA